MKRAWEWFVIKSSRRFWLKRIDLVIGGAYELGHIDSWLLHELDARLKYTPEKKWTTRKNPT
jgi:hypothetical protein